MKTVVLSTDLPFPKKTGKVRDIYDLGDKLLIVTTDRISAFDHVLPNGVPYKGEVLNQLSAFWFGRVAAMNHFISADINEMVSADNPEADDDKPWLDDHCRDVLQKNEQLLTGRSMLVYKCKPLPVECIVRGYLSGSAWSEYKRTGHVCGIKLPKGMKENHPLPEPIFTPSTKAEVGHDQNISLDQMIDLLGGTGIDEQLCEDIVESSIEVYKDAAVTAFNGGIILADTKLEWSHNKKTHTPILIDEVVTPDSSRFWAVENYRLGGAIDSYDKQYVRDYLIKSGWDKESDPPSLPSEVVMTTSLKYREAYRALTGKEL